MRLRAMTLAAVAMLVFGACSSTPAATTKPSAAATAAATAAGGAPAGQLNFTRLSDYPTCFHPICFQTGNQFLAFQLLFNGLVKRDQAEKIIGSLAEKWDVSADATTYTFHLDMHAVWHDGKPVTAEDVVYTVTEGQKNAQAYKDNGTYPITAWLNTKTVEAVDANTVKFTLSAPSAVFLDQITDPAYMIMPKHVLSGQTADQLKTGDFGTGKKVVGSGPYKLVSYAPDQVIEFAANTDYFKGSPKIAKIFYRLKVSPDTAAAQLQSGELGMVLDLKPSDFDVLAKAKGIKVLQTPGLGQESIQFLTTQPQVSDARVRQAIYYAFDRKTLLATVFKGAGRLLWIDAGFDPNDPKLDKYDFNQAKAKDLLAAAAKDGKYDATKPIRIIYSTEEPGWPEIAAALDSDLKKAGIVHEMIPLDGAAWEAKLGTKDWDATVQCCGSPGLGPFKAIGLFPGGTKYDNKEMNDLFTKVGTTGDAAARTAIYGQIGQILNQNVPYNWLWAVAHTDAYTDKLTPQIYPNARESFAQVEQWTLNP